MITDKNFEILYYITPKEYRTIALDQEIDDPNRVINANKSKYIIDLLYNYSLTELISSIIHIFKNKYANPMPIRRAIASYDRDTQKEESKRKDIKNLEFNFKYGAKSIFGGDTHYLDNLFFEFTSPFLNLKSITKASLQGKSFTESSSNNKTVFTINNSPILKIEISYASFLLFIDKNSFIDYGQ